MVNGLLERFQRAKDKVEAQTAARLKYEARRDAFQTDLDTFKEYLRKDGIEPSSLDELIAAAEKDVHEKLTVLETALNGAAETTTEQAQV